MSPNLKLGSHFLGACVVALILSLQATASVAQVFPANSQERKQLIAMGYELDAEKKDDAWTVARLGSSTTLLFSKSEERLVVLRMFSRERKLNSEQELELFKEINRVNNDLPYQVTLDEENIYLSLYDFGEYSPKTFAKIVRVAEKGNSIFDSYPKLLELLNNK